jgi:hypothetical protein
MANEIGLPIAAVIAMWLNSAQAGSVSYTDAANAIETITNQVDLSIEAVNSTSHRSNWLELVTRVGDLKVPVAVGLPVDGNPAGVPGSLLATIVRECGVVALTRELILSQNLDTEWEVLFASNAVIHHDLNQTKRRLLELIEKSSGQLRSSELLGDPTGIVESLENFRTLHLPPHITQRSTSALEMAARVSIVASGAISSSIAIHSPSLDQSRLKMLEALVSESRNVLQSVVVN